MEKRPDNLASHPVRNLNGALFPLNYPWHYGYDLFYRIDDYIDGWIVSNPFDAAALSQMVYNAGDGDHLEIGTGWGGSAIFAALVKRAFSLSGRVVTFDPIEGVDVILHRPRDLEIILANFRRFCVSDSIELITKTFSAEWVEGRRFTSVLIDGSHLYDHVYHDWKDVKMLADRYVMFHDYDDAHQGILRTVRENMDGWRIVHLSGYSLILERL